MTRTNRSATRCRKCKTMTGAASGLCKEHDPAYHVCPACGEHTRSTTTGLGLCAKCKDRATPNRGVHQGDITRGALSRKDGLVEKTFERATRCGRCGASVEELDRDGMMLAATREVLCDGCYQARQRAASQD